MKTLYFEGAGWSGADISKATIGNCRIRTAFHLDDGRAVYLEIIGGERTRNFSKEIYKWKYTGFVTDCYYITDDKPNDDCNEHHVLMPNENKSVENNTVFEYTEDAILKFVNSLGASFDAIKVLPDLAGYRVFPEENSCQGIDGYYYGDEFEYDPELTKQREEVYDYYYDLEKKQGKEYPNFSLWVDEYNQELLHLLRHFPGDFKTAHNTHWILRVKKGADLSETVNTAVETRLGSCGC